MMEVGSTADSEPDPGAGEAINRFRDLAKYIVTIFAAIGALLAAGTQLSSLGQLSPDENKLRLVAAAIALALALATVAFIIKSAVDVLRPIEMSLDDIEADAKVREAVNKHPGLLLGAPSVSALRADVASPLLTDDERAVWLDGVAPVVEYGAVQKVRILFNQAWRNMLWAGAVGALAIAVFAWAANPPKEPASPSPVVQPTPVVVSFTLTDAGRQALGGVLGARCATGEIRALSIGGKQGAPRVVTLPERRCRAAQFTLPADYGTAHSSKPAPRPAH